MFGEKYVGMDLEGSGYGVIEVLPRAFFSRR
jgi:hypothetical protein